MKPKPDEVRKLAKQLYNAFKEEQAKFTKSPLAWRHLLIYEIGVWDAVAAEAFKRIKRK